MNIHVSQEILKYSRKAHYENHMKKSTKDQNDDLTSNEPPFELDHVTSICMIREYFSGMADKVSW